MIYFDYKQTGINLKTMKNSHYIIAGLLVILWGIVTYSFNSPPFAQILLPIAGFIVLLRILFNKNTDKQQIKN
jgi:hypothetical protein